MNDETGLNIVVTATGTLVILLGVAILLLGTEDGLIFSDIAVSVGCVIVGTFMAIISFRDLKRVSSANTVSRSPE